MDDVVPQGLKTFDAFPKVSSSYSVHSVRGSRTTVLLAVSFVFLIWVQLANYLTGFEEQQFSVDKQVAKDMQINLDITVTLPCKSLSVDVADRTRDRLLASELLSFEPIDFDGSYGVGIYDEAHMKRSTEDLESTLRKARRDRFRRKKLIPAASDTFGCRIYGSVPVTKVSGDLQITANGYAYRGANVLDRDTLNFTHVIDELSFGEYYPRLDNPLDGVLAVAKSNAEIMQYFISVVPTEYKGLGQGSTSIETNQYAVTQQIRRADYSQLAHAPGIFFRYTIEPIHVSIKASRLAFSKFFLRLINILAGVYIIWGWVYGVVDGQMGRRTSRKGQGMIGEMEKV